MNSDAQFIQEAAEEALRKELEKNKMVRRRESPTRPDFVEEKDDGIENPRSKSKIDKNESLKTLKNSSACTIVNISREGSKSAKNLVLPMLEKPCEMPRSGTKFEDIESQSKQATFPDFDTKKLPNKIPCRLPRIVLQNKHAIHLKPQKETMGDTFKLPDISNSDLVRDVCVEAAMPSDKLVQVPSRDEEKLVSFSQQTSKLMVDNSSSFHKNDIDNTDIKQR